MSMATRRFTLAGGVAAIALGIASTVGLRAVAAGADMSPRAAVTSAAHISARPPTAPGRSVAASCNVPSLPGAVVDITLRDMGGAMGRGARSASGRMGTQGGAIGTRAMGARGTMARAMSIASSRGSIRAGTVTLEVSNQGSVTHEVVVLPLTGAARVGQRTVGNSDKVSEAGSLGEASSTCGAGAGEGIAAGSLSWVTLRLAPGRYELVCNIAGHYAAGMYAELDVTA